MVGERSEGLRSAPDVVVPGPRALRFRPMPSTAELQELPYKRGQKIRLVDNIPGHLAGSKGKVAVANGFAWLRYWIRFPDGSTAGHVDHGSLVKAEDYDTFLVARDREAIEAEHAATQTEAVADAGSGGGGAAGGGVEVNGVMIPQPLLDRSAAARARLSG